MDFLFLEIVYNELKEYTLERISTLLEEFDIYDFELKEPMKRSPLDYYANNLEISPDYYAVKVYLEENEENKNLLQEIEKRVTCLEGVKHTVQGRVEECEWKDKWKLYFKPTKIGNSIVVRPTWEAYEAKEGEKVIVIDPKMAFGTGTHATTAHCLRFVEKYVKEGSTVLDIGTGSSILLVASHLFKASKLKGVDIDEDALESARENLILNGVTEFDLSTSLDGSEQYSVVIANIICEVLIELFESMVAKVERGGVLMLSGILEEKCEKMERVISHYQLEIIEKASEEGWVGYVCNKGN